MKDVVTETFDYANGDQFESAGFFLLLTLSCGRKVRGAPYRPKDGIVELDAPDDNGTRQKVFVPVAHVTSCEVEW